MSMYVPARAHTHTHRHCPERHALRQILILLLSLRIHHTSTIPCQSTYT